MSEESGKKWYVVRAISGKEKRVKEYLESEVKRLNLQDHITQILIPTEKVFQIRKGKKLAKSELFSWLCPDRSGTYR